MVVSFEARTEIERVYLVEVDVTADSNEEALAWAAEVALPLVIDYTLVAPLVIDNTRVNHTGVVRFTGSRTRLAELVRQLKDRLTVNEHVVIYDEAHRIPRS